GAERLAETREEEILDRLSFLRAEAGDRAILRALHFHRENERVQEITEALENDDMKRYLAGVRASASSSWRLLQNYLPTTTVREQAIALTAALLERLFPDAVARVHGGGFAGAVQVYVREEEFPRFENEMERLYGPGSVIPLRIRSRAAGPLGEAYSQSREG
ncbi:MAG: galactokinase, partial [Spirochaetota bacterium]